VTAGNQDRGGAGDVADHHPGLTVSLETETASGSLPGGRSSRAGESGRAGGSGIAGGAPGSLAGSIF